MGCKQFALDRRSGSRPFYRTAKALRAMMTCEMILFSNERLAHHEARNRRKLFGHLDWASHLSDRNPGKH
jgi:hypothetical protein